jgi:DNA replication protein DnaC
MPNALHKIHVEAKRLRKKHPNTAWKNLIKQASRNYNNGSLGKTVRRAVKKVKAAKRHRVKHESTRLKKVSGITVAKAKAVYKTKVYESLGSLLIRKEKTTGKRNKRKIGKLITEKRSELRRIN